MGNIPALGRSIKRYYRRNRAAGSGCTVNLATALAEGNAAAVATYISLRAMCRRGTVDLRRHMHAARQKREQAVRSAG